MAQILKEEVRNKIIEAAKEEFLSFGFKAASMRRIAQKSEMTVGNLYRYFASKDAINEFIVAPTLNEINNLVMSITSNNISISNPEFNVKYTIPQLKEMLANLIDRLGDIAYKRKIEFRILLMRSKLNDEIVDWFKQLIKYFIITNYGLTEYTEKIEIVSGCYAVAIIEGFKRCLDDCKDEATFNELSKIFMLSYLSMLENDIGKYIGE